MSQAPSKSVQKKLRELRKKIDQADVTLLRAFAARFDAVEEVGRLKRKEKMPVVQKARWNELMADRLKKARKLGVSEPFVKTVYSAIHREAIRIQKGKK